jgi:DNA-binding response OmpR family regulator
MPLSVLIVDPSLAMRMLLERALKVSGLSVSQSFHASDGHTALEILEQHSVSFMLLDAQLSEMGAEEFLRCVRDRSGAQPLPFLVTSADATPARIQRMLDLGASDYLVKPFPIAHLCSRLRCVLPSSEQSAAAAGVQ